MRSTFSAIPVRRRILELLGDQRADGVPSLSAGDITAAIRGEFAISQPAVSQHLKVLRESGFTSCTADGQRRLYAIDGRALQGGGRVARPVPSGSGPADWTPSTPRSAGTRARTPSRTTEHGHEHHRPDCSARPHGAIGHHVRRAPSDPDAAHVRNQRRRRVGSVHASRPRPALARHDGRRPTRGRRGHRPHDRRPHGDRDRSRSCAATRHGASSCGGTGRTSRSRSSR